jgi:hypothetical protein
MASDSSPSAGPGSRSRTSRPGWWPGISTLRLPAEATRNAVLCALRKSRSPAREMLQIDGSALAPPEGGQVTLGGELAVAIAGCLWAKLGRLLSIARRSRQDTQPEWVPPAPR